jgi:hypothetical protein
MYKSHQCSNDSAKYSTRTNVSCEIPHSHCSLTPLILRAHFALNIAEIHLNATLYTGRCEGQ